MQTLNRSYHDFEHEAGNYADADRAWQEARRRRAARRTGLVSVLAAVVVGGGVLGATRLVEDRQVATPASPGISTIAPPASAPDLPADAPVAEGVLVYTACPSGCPTFLLTKDGRQYRLGQQIVVPPGNFTLSPDGRWLGQPDAQGYSLRQLDGTTVLRVPAPAGDAAGLRTSPWAWSPDSRTLVVGAHRDGVVEQWTGISFPAAEVSDAAVPRGYEPVGITGAGELVLLPDDAYGTTSNRLSLVEGDARRGLTLLAPGRAQFTDSEHGPWVRVVDEHIFALVYSGDSTQVVTYTMSGKLLDQVELSGTEAPVGIDQGGLVVIDVPESGGPTATLVRLAGVDRVRLAEVPAQALVALPGATRG